MDVLPKVVAKGLARQEFNLLSKSFYGESETETPLVRVDRFIRSYTDSLFTKGKRLSPTQVKEIEQGISDIFSGFRHAGDRVENVPGMGVQKTHVYECAVPQTGQVSNSDLEEVFREDCVDFRSIRFCLSRRKIIIDDMISFCCVSRHVLTRMIERDQVDQTPIAHILENIETIRAYNALFLLTHTAEVAIPLDGGLLVGQRMGFLGNDLIVRPRIIYSEAGSGLSFTPGELPLAHKSSINRISTFLGYDTLRIEQKWVRAALMALFRDHPEGAAALSEVARTPVNGSSIDSSIVKLIKDFGLIKQHEHWIAFSRNSKSNLDNQK